MMPQEMIQVLFPSQTQLREILMTTLTIMIEKRLFRKYFSYGGAFSDIKCTTQYKSHCSRENKKERLMSSE